MEPDEGLLTARYFNDEIGVKNAIYEPLTLISKADIKRQFIRTVESKNFYPLFCDNSTIQPQNATAQEELQNEESLKEQLNKDKRLKKIFTNTKEKNVRGSQGSKSSAQLRNALYSFNFDSFSTFQQTPSFKQSLQSPLTKFCNTYKQKIIDLYKQTSKKQKVKELDLKTSPLLFKDIPGVYFMGLALNLRNKGLHIQPLFFYHLAAYSEPFNPKIWEEYCQALKKVGYWKRAAVIAKTAFLFNPVSSLAQQYFLCAEKAAFPPYEIRGLLSSLKEPLNYEKLFLQSAKIEMKHRKTWRGLMLLFYYCLTQDFKATLSQTIIFLIKNFEVLQFKQISAILLNRAISQKLSKYEAFNLYIEVQQRLNNGRIGQQQLKFLERKIKNLASQTRYRIYLDMAESVKENPQLRNKFYRQALQTAKKCCNQQTNRKRAYRHIYMSIMSILCLQPEPQLVNRYIYDDHLLFLTNKARFIRGKPLQIYNFQDWKYYLHYCLDKNADILKKSYQKFNQGRLLAEYIHVMRLRKNSLAIMKLWRKKIEESPKSGQLWCEGGRIYIQMKEYSNAKKCFLAAIHFTPQYGDSFFQLLKIFLIENKFLEINQLRKNFIISEPFYGNVFSYLRTSKWERSSVKLSSDEIWNLCKSEIEKQIYNHNQEQRVLTCCQSYNEAYITLPSKQIRERLFVSYELIQNKFSK